MKRTTEHRPPYQDPAETGRERHSLFRSYYALTLTFLIGTIISIVLFQSIIGNNMKEKQREFYNHVMQQYLLITKDVQILGQFIEDTQAFFAASEKVFPSEFRYFAGPAIRRQPKLLLFAWIPARETGDARNTDFLLYQGIKDAEFAANIINMPVIRNILRKPEDGQRVVTSAAFSQVVDEMDGSGVPLIGLAAPTYNYIWEEKQERPGEPTGYLLAIIRVKPFVMQANIAERGIFKQVHIYLSNPAGTRDLIYKKTASAEILEGETEQLENFTRAFPVFRTIDIPFGSRTLYFVYIPSSDFLAGAANWTAWLVLLLGFVLTIAVAVFLQLILSRNIQIRELVKKRTGELEKSEETQKAILRNIADGVLTMDESGIIHGFNPACEKIFGYSADEIMGQNIKTLIPQPYWGDLEQLSMGAEAKGIVKERTGNRKDGSEFPMEISFGGIKSGEPNQYVAVIRDISDRKQAEESLRRSNQALDDFVYIVSHDLKEPLRSIQNFSAIMQEDCEENLDSECREHLDTILRVAKRMQDQLDSLLKYSRASHQEMTLEDVDAGQVVDEVTDSLKALIMETETEITVNGPLPVIRCDRSCLVEIFTNLIQNAIKYRREQVRPSVKIGALASPPGELKGPALYVKDNGIGIGAEYTEKIFKMFQRLHGRDQYGGGTGSGLAIVKKLVEKHNGAVWVESEPGKGSTFFFTMQGQTF